MPIFEHIFEQLYRGQMDPGQKSNDGFIRDRHPNVTLP